MARQYIQFKVSRYACRNCLTMTDRLYTTPRGEVIACSPACAKADLTTPPTKTFRGTASQLHSGPTTFVRVKATSS